MLATIIDIGAGVFTALALFYARPSAQVAEVQIAAIMLYVAGAAQLILAAASWFDDAIGQLFVSAVWATVALSFASLTWDRGTDMDEAAGEREGDLW